jgi:organic hydroperoxide reductase OsmC/OhrA
MGSFPSIERDYNGCLTFETTHATQSLAHWQGSTKEGTGTLSTQSATLKDTPYSFKARFGDGKGTNPEELLAAAHAGCFTMAVSFTLNNAGTIGGHRHRSAAHDGNAQQRSYRRGASGHARPRAQHRRRAVCPDRQRSQGNLRHLACDAVDHRDAGRRSPADRACLSMGPSAPVKGRGATFNPANRFRRDEREPVDDG